MQRFFIVALTVATVFGNLAHGHKMNFETKTVRPLYKKIYDALNHYQSVGQLNYTTCYRKNGHLFAPKLENSNSMLIEELTNITKEFDNLLININVSIPEKISDNSTELKHFYHQMQQILNSRNPGEKLTNITKLNEQWNKEEIKEIINEMNEFKNQISDDHEKLNVTSDISQNWVKWLLQNTCKKNPTSCSDKLVLNQKLIEAYGSLAMMEMKLVVLTVNKYLLNDASAVNNEKVIREFRTIIKNSILRTADYMTVTETLKKQLALEKEAQRNRLNSIDAVRSHLATNNYTLPDKCQPFSWKTEVNYNDEKGHLKFGKTGLAPAGILNFAVKSTIREVFIKLRDEKNRNRVKIAIEDNEIEILVKNEIKMTYTSPDYFNSLVHAKGYRGYWIKWENNRVTLGKAGTTEALIDWPSSINTSTLTHFAVSNANWILYDLPPQSKTEARRTTCWSSKTVEGSRNNDTMCRILWKGTYRPGTIRNDTCWQMYPSDYYQNYPFSVMKNYEIPIGKPGHLEPRSGGDDNSGKNSVISGIKKTFGIPVYICPPKPYYAYGDRCLTVTP